MAAWLLSSSYWFILPWFLLLLPFVLNRAHKLSPHTQEVGLPELTAMCLGTREIWSLLQVSQAPPPPFFSYSVRMHLVSEFALILVPYSGQYWVPRMKQEVSSFILWEKAYLGHLNLFYAARLYDFSHSRKQRKVLPYGFHLCLLFPKLWNFWSCF